MRGSRWYTDMLAFDWILILTDNSLFGVWCRYQVDTLTEEKVFLQHELEGTNPFNRRE